MIPAPVMSVRLLLATILVPFFQVTSEERDNDHVASVLEAEEIASRKCQYDFHKLWSHEVGHSPFVSPPLIADIDGDGTLDVLATPFTEAAVVIEGETGKTLSDSYWPVQFTDRSFHGSPLQFDADGDGMLDVLLVTSAGELLFYTSSGQLMSEYSLTVPPVYVRRDWYTQVVTISHTSVHDFILDDPPTTQEENAYLSVDPHVLATPVLADLNNDDRVEELILPVSYYYDAEDYILPEMLHSLSNITLEDLDKYLVSAVVSVNLTSLKILHTVHLDLTQVSAVFPGYLLSSPTVIDLDSQNGPLEIVVGTAAGNLHVIESTGAHRRGFPITTNSLTAQVVVADLHKNDSLQLVSVDLGGNVACHSRHGDLLWEFEVSGPVVSGMRLSDVNTDGKTDIIVTTQEGTVHALSGDTGAEIHGWPVKLGFKVTANALITRLSRLRLDSVDMVFLADDGNLYLVSSDRQCKAHIPVGETSLVQVLSHDLVAQSEGLELLITTRDGTLLCYGRGYQQGWTSSSTENLETNLHAVPTELKSHNDFYYGQNKVKFIERQSPVLCQSGVVIKQSGGVKDVSSSTFWLQYEILGLPPKTGQLHIKVYFGRQFLIKTSHPHPGKYFLLVPSWLVPSQGHVTVSLTNYHGQVHVDVMPVRFHRVALQDLQWLLCGPFIAMSILVLIIHGFPAKDLLPVTVPSKSR